MRVAALAAVLVVAAGCAAGDDASPRDERVGTAGVTVEVPAGWHTAASRDGNVTDPLTRIAVSSAPLDRPVPGCQVASYAPRPDAVSLVVVEWKPSDDAHPPPRPTSFGPDELRIQPPPAIECFDGAGGAVQFVDRGRTFGAFLLVGREARDGLAAEARAVLGTMDVSPR